jgi:hypothetical protein
MATFVKSLDTIFKILIKYIIVISLLITSLGRYDYVGTTLNAAAEENDDHFRFAAGFN